MPATKKTTQDYPDPWVDGAFRIQKNKWETWVSFDKMENKLVTSPTEESCIDATRFYLKSLQDKVN